MKQATKAVIIVFIVLISLAVPLYYYTRPPTIEAGTIQITGNINKPQNLTLSQIEEEYPSTTIQATLTSSGNPSDNGVFNYTGVLLRDILNQSEVSASATSIYVQASDGYGATFSMQEAQKDNILIAYKKDDAALTPLKSGGEGTFRLIVGGDAYAQRWIKGIISIKVT